MLCDLDFSVISKTSQSDPNPDSKLTSQIQQRTQTIDNKLVCYLSDFPTLVTKI